MTSSTLEIGDLVSVPFTTSHAAAVDLSRGRYRGLPSRQLRPQPAAPMDYVDMGGWIGGQADYVMVPYADFNLLKFPEKAQAMEKIRDLACLSDISTDGIPRSRHPQKSASDRRSTSPARGPSASRPRRPRRFLEPRRC